MNDFLTVFLMNDFLLVFLISFLGIFAIYGLCHFIDSIIERNKPRHRFHTPDQEIGYMLIKRDAQGAQASVHFNSDFDLFQYEDGDYIFLGVKVEEVAD